MGSCNFISSTEGAMECLGGIAFPATKEDILGSIMDSDGPEAVVVAANQIPDKLYQNMDELLEYLDSDQE